MKKVSLLAIVGAVFLLGSCATTVNYSVVRPAELDMNGANTISVLPFKPSRRSDLRIRPARRGEKREIYDFFFSYSDLREDEADVIRFINNELESGLAKSEYLHLVDSKEVERALRHGNANQIVDVYLAGEILCMDVEDETIVNKKVVESEEKKPVGGKTPVGGKEPIGGKEPVGGKVPVDGKKTEIETSIKFKRHVYLNYIYEIIDAETDEVISCKEVEIKKSSSEYNSPRNLPDPIKIIEYDLKSDMKKILKSVQPYSVDRSLSLMENKNEKDAFEVADNMIEIGDFEGAYIYYNKIYEKQGIFEAGYNAAILLEVLGRFDEADDLMADLYLSAENSKQSRKAKWALDDIRYEANQYKKLRGQLMDQQERSEDK